MSKESLKCCVRKISVSSTPEEIVRQSLLRYMISHLGYPLEYLVVEKELSLISGLSCSLNEVPQRRADIVCYAKGIHSNHGLYPLLLIECKSTPLNEKVKNQVIGYNRYLQAYFVSIVNQNTFLTGWFDKVAQKYQFFSGLPPYQYLVKSIKIY